MSSVKRKNTDCCSLKYFNQSTNTSSCSLKHSTTNDSKFFFNEQNIKNKTTPNKISSYNKYINKHINHSLYPITQYSFRETSLTNFDFKNSKCDNCLISLNNIEHIILDKIVCKSCQDELYKINCSKI